MAEYWAGIPIVVGSTLAVVKHFSSQTSFYLNIYHQAHKNYDYVEIEETRFSFEISHTRTDLNTTNMMFPHLPKV